MFTRIHHVAFLVGDLDEAIAQFESRYGVEQLARREMTGEFELAVALYPVGESLVELITPTSESGWVYETYHEQGPGLFHVAFAADDVHERMAELRAAGVTFESEVPQEGLDWLVATLDPADTIFPMQLVEDEKTPTERIEAFRTSGE